MYAYILSGTAAASYTNAYQQDLWLGDVTKRERKPEGWVITACTYRCQRGKQTFTWQYTPGTHYPVKIDLRPMCRQCPEETVCLLEGRFDVS